LPRYIGLGFGIRGRSEAVLFSAFLNPESVAMVGKSGKGAPLGMWPSLPEWQGQGREKRARGVDLERKKEEALRMGSSGAHANGWLLSLRDLPFRAWREDGFIDFADAGIFLRPRIRGCGFGIHVA
jgi:hypothetical protein